MKDMDMSDRQERLLKGKAVLDKCIKLVSPLAAEAYKESLACCANEDLDQRDQFAEVAAHLRAAESALIMARSKAGQIDGGGIVRGGGT